MDTNIGYMSPSSFFLWQDAHVASLAGQWARMLLGSLYPQFVFMALRKYVKELHCNNIQVQCVWIQCVTRLTFALGNDHLHHPTATMTPNLRPET